MHYAVHSWERSILHKLILVQQISLTRSLSSSRIIFWPLYQPCILADSFMVSFAEKFSQISCYASTTISHFLRWQSVESGKCSAYQKFKSICSIEIAPDEIPRLCRSVLPWIMKRLKVLLSMAVIMLYSITSLSNSLMQPRDYAPIS